MAERPGGGIDDHQLQAGVERQRGARAEHHAHGQDLGSHTDERGQVLALVAIDEADHGALRRAAE